MNFRKQSTLPRKDPQVPQSPPSSLFDALKEDDEGRLLLGQKLDSGQWGTVGGAVEPGESPRDAAVREAREETGLHVEVMNVVDVLGGADFGVTYANGDECSYVSSTALL